MDRQIISKRIFFRLVIFICLIHNTLGSNESYSQNPSVTSKSLLLITFGSGQDQFSRKTPTDFNFSTTENQLYNFSAEDGTFTFANTVPNNNNAWHTDALDNTLDDTGGYMYADNVKDKDSEIFNTTLNGLSIGFKYEFSAYLANLIKSTSRYVKPDVRFEVRTATEQNHLLGQFSTGSIPEYGSMFWQKYDFTFITSSQSVVLLMVSNVGGTGNDLAIDDIEVRSCSSEHPGFCFLGTYTDISCTGNNPTVGSSVFLITFGSGSDQYLKKVPSEFGFNNSFKQLVNFEFVHTIPRKFNLWHYGAFDHTENDQNGYMYLLDIEGENSVLFRYTVNDLCVGYQYTFSAYLANIFKTRTGPNIRFEVRNAMVGNQLLVQLNTSEISATRQLIWNRYGLSFNATSSSVILLIISNTQANVGNDLVMDDIELRMCSTGRSKFCYPNEIFPESTTSCSDFAMTFGSGTEIHSKDAPFDWNFRTSYQQDFGQTEKGGTLNLVNVVPDRYTAWHQGELDHTPNDHGGYMLLIDGGESGSEFFDFIFDNLCIGVRYEISVYVANIGKRNSSGNLKPNILFQVRMATIDNHLLAELETGEMDAYDRLIWFKYTLSFTASSNAVVLLMFSNAVNAPGNNFVIDDIELRVCSSSLISLLPNAPSLEKPLHVRQIQDVYINSDINMSIIQSSSSITYQWTMFNRSSSSIKIPLVNNTRKEVLFRSETLSFGIYEVRCTILIKNNVSTLLSTTSIYIKIVNSYFITNLVSLGRLNITHHYQQDLLLNPAKYSTAPDQLIFYPHKWNYKYYYRIYDSENIESFQLLNNFSQISINISSQLFKLNQTYQFFVHMTHHDDVSLHSIGYLIVYVQDLIIRTISLDCSMASMCSPMPEFQYLNQHTELTLISQCFDYCPSNVNISWKIYFYQDAWILFDQNSDLIDNKLTITLNFFEDHKEILHWRFDVFYSFHDQINNNNTINITVNKSPENGSCSIHPLNGTRQTLFTINCSNWIDSDGIKDYSFYGLIENSTKRFSFGSTSKSTYELQFLPTLDEVTFYQLIIHIRDVFSSITEFKLSSIMIFTNITSSINLIENLDNLIRQSFENNTQTNVAQQVSTLSNILNDLNEKNLDILIKNGISPSTIAVSSLSNHPSNVSNVNIPSGFDEQLNKYAIMRETLMIRMTNLSTVSIDDLNSQSSILSEITQTTNQLTRKTSTLASNKCHQLSQILEVSSSKIPKKDIQTVSTHLLECAANVMTGVNGPLQDRTKALTIDSNRLDRNTNDRCRFFIDDERNLCYQKETANLIRNQMNEMISSITTSLIINLSVNESILINTDSVYFSLEKLSTKSLNNYTRNHVHLPSNIDHLSNSNVILRSMIEPLAFADDFQSETTMNFSRSISFSLLDENGQVISLNTTFDHSIEIFIPRDLNLIIRKMSEQNVTNKSMFYNYHTYHLQKKYSIDFEFHSFNNQISYLLTYRFDSSLESIGWEYFCSKKRDEIFVFFLNNNQTNNHRTVTFVIRELNSAEVKKYCENNTSDLLMFNSPMKFSSNYEIRSYLSACFYLNEQNKWQSDGLLVGLLTNHSQTHCLLTHI